MLWRLPRGGKLWEERKGEKNKTAFRELVASGSASGVIAFHERTPVGWCSTGPRTDFPKLDNSPSLRLPMPDTAWVISCFYIPAPWRGLGVGTLLLQEAVRYAEQEGASALYGFPVEPAAGGTVPAAFAWTGLPKMFTRAGFRAVRSRPKRRRPVYRKMFRSSPR